MSRSVSAIRQLQASTYLIAELGDLFDDEGQSLDKFRRELKGLFGGHRWGWFGSGRTFNINARHLYCAISSARYHRARRAQLIEGGFAYWGILGCAEHDVLNGLCLAPSHSFWSIRFPPFSWSCGCHVAGFRQRTGAVRLDCDIDKQLPSEWGGDGTSGLPPGVDVYWNSIDGPDLLTIIAAIVDGHVPSET